MSQIKVEGILQLDGSGWDRTLRTAQDKVTHFANDGLSHLKGMVAGAFAIGAIESFVHSTAEAMTIIKDFSEQAGITTDEVQLLQIAARKVGLEFEDFQRALTKVGSARKEAAESNKDLRTVFAAYGITLEDLNNPMLKNVDLLEKMKTRIEQLSSTAAGREDLKTFFGGKGGDKLGVALEEYFKLKQNIANTPLFSDKDIENVDRFEKSIKEVKRQIEVKAGSGLGAISGMFNEPTAAGKFKSYLRAVTMNPLLPPALGQLVNRFDSESSNTTSGSHESGAAAAGGGGSMFFDKVKEAEENQILESRLKLYEAQHKLAYDALTDDQKKLELQKEINQLLIDAAAIEPSSEVLANDLRTQATGKMGELQSLQRSLGNGASSNSLMQVGNFLGTGSQAVTGIAQKTNDLLMGIQRTLSSIDTKMGSRTTGVPPV